MLRERDVLIEFYRMSGYVKVSAVDPETYIELCRVGDPAAGEELLSCTALPKLKRSRVHASGQSSPMILR